MKCVRHRLVGWNEDRSSEWKKQHQQLWRDTTHSSLATLKAGSCVFHCLLLSWPREAWWNLGESKHWGVKPGFEAQALGKWWMSGFLPLFRKRKAKACAPICSAVEVLNEYQSFDNLFPHVLLLGWWKKRYMHYKLQQGQEMWEE